MSLVYKWGRKGIHIGYLWENQKERDHQEEQDVDRWIILNWMGWYGLD
jgi:hypothetical protein